MSHESSQGIEMYPLIGRVGGIEITSFGLMVALAVLAGLWLFRRELAATGLDPKAENAGLAGALGGLAGAKLIWTLEFSGSAPWNQLLLSRAGLSWFGGFAGGLTAGLLTLRLTGVPLIPALAAAAPALAVGHAIGRIGCFLVGDDYGSPSDLPWAVAFPEGLPPTFVPVHPTQLYETVFLLALAAFLIRARRRETPAPRRLAMYFIGAGAFRFVLEFIRINEPVLLGATVAQLWSLGIVAVGVGLWRRR